MVYIISMIISFVLAWLVAWAYTSLQMRLLTKYSKDEEFQKPYGNKIKKEVRDLISSRRLTLTLGYMIFSVIAIVNDKSPVLEKLPLLFISSVASGFFTLLMIDALIVGKHELRLHKQRKTR